VAEQGTFNPCVVGSNPTRLTKAAEASTIFIVRLSDGAKTSIDADGDPATLEAYGFAGWLSGAGAVLLGSAVTGSHPFRAPLGDDPPQTRA
jgi:hypothetical protein